MAIVEVKGPNQPCSLNGPWTIEERQNINRVLTVIGCVPHDLIGEAAAGIYRHSIAEHDGIRIHLISVGCAENLDLADRYPQVLQVCKEQTRPFSRDVQESHSRELRVEESVPLRSTALREGICGVRSGRNGRRARTKDSSQLRAGVRHQRDVGFVLRFRGL